MTFPTSPLSEVATLLSGGTPSKADPGLWDGRIPWVSPKDMDQWLLDDTEDHIASAAIGNGTRLAPVGATLIVVRSMGLASRVQIAFPTRDVAFNQDLKAVVPKPGIQPRFLFYALAAARPRIHEQVDEASHGTKRIQTHVLEKLPIPVPAEVTQTAIAMMLGVLDDKIGLNMRTQSTLFEMAQATFDSVLLAATDLPLVPLRDAVDFAYGKALRADGRHAGPVTVMGSNGPIGVHNEMLVDGPGIVIGRKGNPGIVTWVDKAFWPIDTTFFVKPLDGWSLPYLFFELCRLDLPRLAADSAVPGLNRDIALSTPIRKATESIQRKLAADVLPMFALREGLRVESAILGELRDALLPELISGRMTVN